MRIKILVAFLLLYSVFLQAQIKVGILPDTASYSSSNWLIIDDSLHTRKISIANFIKNLPIHSQPVADSSNKLPNTAYVHNFWDTIALLDNFLKRAGWFGYAPSVTLASASTVNLGSTNSNMVTITGNGTINSFGIAPANVIFYLIFTGQPLLVYNSTSMITPTNSNLTVNQNNIGDILTMLSLGGGNWKCVSYYSQTGSYNNIFTAGRLPFFNAGQKLVGTNLGYFGSYVIDTTGNYIGWKDSTKRVATTAYVKRAIDSANSLINYVPYSGAKSNIDLNNKNLSDVASFTATSLTTTGLLTEAPCVTVASANTINLGALNANCATIIGNTTINSFGIAPSGLTMKITFSNTPTLNYNSTSMILPVMQGAGTVNIACAAGDFVLMQSLGSGNWKCLVYQRESDAFINSTYVGAHFPYYSNSTLMSSTLTEDTNGDVNLGHANYSAVMDSSSKAVSTAKLKAIIDSLQSVVGSTTSTLTTNYIFVSIGGITKKITFANFLAMSSGGSGTGIFSIVNSSGTPTYYSTFTLAEAAASAGQCIEMLTDVVETNSVTVTLVNGVNINGHGHTYTLNNSGTSSCLSDGGNNIICSINNINFKRIGGSSASPTGNTCLYLTGRSIISGNGAYYGSKAYAVILNNPICQLIGAFGTTDSTNNMYASVFYVNKGTLLNCSASINTLDPTFAIANVGGFVLGCTTFSRGYGAGIYSSGGAVNNSTGYCYGVNSGAGISINGGTCGNSFGYGYNYGFSINDNNTTCYVSNCSGFATNGIGLYIKLTTSKVLNCSGGSYGGLGGYVYNGHLQNCSFFSTSTYGLQTDGANDGTMSLDGCSAYSTVAPAYTATGTTSLKVNNCTFKSDLNSSSGHAIITNGSIANINNCSFTVLNASSNCINAASTYTISYNSNIFTGATTPVNANITQGNSNLADLQGNIKN